MPRNVEWKGRLPDLAAAVTRAADLGDPAHSFERQLDAYFRVPVGRLKLRRRWLAEPGTAASTPPHAWAELPFETALPPELIGYRRPDQGGARASDYVRVLLPADSAMAEALDLALGVEVEVEKIRLVFVHDAVRIHLDDVRECGRFLELEAIVSENCSDDEAHAKIQRLLEHFRLSKASPLPGSYRELVLGAA